MSRVFWEFCVRQCCSEAHAMRLALHRSCKLSTEASRGYTKMTPLSVGRDRQSKPEAARASAYTFTDPSHSL